MALYIFSDAHLGSNDRELEDLKISKIADLFRKVLDDGDRLIILGDLFDFWFEYKHAMPKEHMPVLFMLNELVLSGIEIDYISGNHDFWMDDFFSNQMKMRVHLDTFDTEYESLKIHLTHGDGLAKSDGGYRFLKKILRNRFNIWAYRKLPTDWAIPLAKYVSGSSRKHTSKREYNFDAEYEQYAQAKLSEGYDVVAIGHLHRPSIKEFPEGVYVNSGDFIDSFSYVKISNGKAELLYL